MKTWLKKREIRGGGISWDVTATRWVYSFYYNIIKLKVCILKWDMLRNETWNANWINMDHKKRQTWLISNMTSLIKIGKACGRNRFGPENKELNNRQIKWDYWAIEYILREVSAYMSNHLPFNYIYVQLKHFF